MEPKYKVHYFDITGLGEPLRYLLSYANLDFQDIRYSIADWPKRKAEMPLKKMPVLEIDGVKHPQSAATCRYLAKKCELTGKTDMEDLEIDKIVDICQDLHVFIIGWNYDPVEESKKKKYEPLIKEHLPMYLNYLESCAKKNYGYLAAGRLTWADFYFVGPLEFYKDLVGFDFLEKYPLLKNLESKVRSIPQIAAFVTKTH